MTERHKIMTRCVNAHDRCGGGGRCDYCEPVWPLRTEDGRFAVIEYDFSTDDPRDAMLEARK